MGYASYSWLLWVFGCLAVVIIGFGLWRAKTRARSEQSHSDQPEVAADLGAYDTSLVAERAQRAALSDTSEPLSDLGIAREIHERLRMEDTLSGTHLDVRVDTGHVSLSGSVDTDHQRARAVAIASAVNGVVQVSPRMSVRE